MTIKVGEKEYCLEGYAYEGALRKVLAEVYQQGRADKYQEIISEYMLLTEQQVADIRTDAIDECIKIVGNDTCIYSCKEDDCVRCEIKQMEQLKENE